MRRRPVAANGTARIWNARRIRSASRARCDAVNLAASPACGGGRGGGSRLLMSARTCPLPARFARVPPRKRGRGDAASILDPRAGGLDDRRPFGELVLDEGSG